MTFANTIDISQPHVPSALVIIDYTFPALVRYQDRYDSVATEGEKKQLESLRDILSKTISEKILLDMDYSMEMMISRNYQNIPEVLKQIQVKLLKKTEYYNRIKNNPRIAEFRKKSAELTVLEWSIAEESIRRFVEE
jgi:hypothetical protein